MTRQQRMLWEQLIVALDEMSFAIAGTEETFLQKVSEVRRLRGLLTASERKEGVHEGGRWEVSEAVGCSQ